MSILEAIILAIVEGLTEFLPVSSTGHMIIASSFMGIASNDFVKMFTVAIQFGAILSVVVLYFKRFFQSVDFYIKLFVAFLPAVVFGLLLSDFIDDLLENVLAVAIALLIGGIILLFVDNWFGKNGQDLPGTKPEPDDNVTNNVKPVSYAQAIKIGLFQCIAMVPGVSRSAASIVGGMSQGLSRKAAAEFSFFLAVPTMFGATVKKMYDSYKDHPEILSSDNLQILLLGNIVAFIVAMLAIKFFIAFLTKYGFKVFGWYRIAIGLLLIILLSAGYDLQIV